MSLLYYMFQSILNIFAFVFSFGVKKLIIFTDGGYPPPFAENSAKIINLIFATFPNGVFKNLSEKFEGCFKSVSTCVQSSRCPAIFRGFDFKRFSF